MQYVALYKALGGGWELYDELPPLKEVQPALLATVRRLTNDCIERVYLRQDDLSKLGNVAGKAVWAEFVDQALALQFRHRPACRLRCRPEDGSEIFPAEQRASIAPFSRSESQRRSRITRSRAVPAKSSAIQRPPSLNARCQCVIRKAGGWNASNASGRQPAAGMLRYAAGQWWNAGKTGWPCIPAPEHRSCPEGGRSAGSRPEVRPEDTV